MAWFGWCATAGRGSRTRLSLRSLARRTREIVLAVQAVACEAMVALLLAGILSGCSLSPERQEALRRAWAERDAEQAQECHRHNLGFVAGGCTSPGGP
jgi:hypothetical protein